MARYAHRVRVPPAPPGGPAPAVPNLFGVDAEHHDEEQRQYVAAARIRLHFRLKARRSNMALRRWANLARRAIQADHHARQYVAAAKIRLHFRLKARRSNMALRRWANLARRAIQADHHAAAIVMSRGPAYVTPTPSSFPHRTPGGPVPTRGDTIPPEHIGQIMDALQAQEDAGRAQGQNFTKRINAMQQQQQQQMRQQQQQQQQQMQQQQQQQQQQMQQLRQQQQQQMRVMQQQHRDAMDAVQAQVIDARRTADAAAADATAMYPRLSSVLEGSAFAIDKALLEMSAQGQAQSRAQSEQLQEAVSSLRAEYETALDAVRAGTGRRSGCAGCRTGRARRGWRAASHSAKPRAGAQTTPLIRYAYS
jgi:hypothetical protein